MSTLLKDLYTEAFIRRFASIAASILPAMEKEPFVQSVLAPGWEAMALKQRMRRITVSMGAVFPSPFPEALPLLKALVQKLQEENFRGSSIEFLFLPDYIECNGLDHPQEAVEAMECTTQFISCEFAVRPYIIRYPGMLYPKMLEWSVHENAAVRRLASEGLRPRLPWAMALPALKKDPAPILPVLENLRSDPSESVRRSVANNLNDISKDHPALVLNLVRQWMGKDDRTDALLKHGCRTLLKQGDPSVMQHFGFAQAGLELNAFELDSHRVSRHGMLHFGLEITNTSTVSQVVRLEYAIHFMRKKGPGGRKVFKISERVYGAGETSTIRRGHSFRPITTRKYYPGAHQVSIILNGKEMQSRLFELLEMET